MRFKLALLVTMTVFGVFLAGLVSKQANAARYQCYRNGASCISTCSPCKKYGGTGKRYCSCGYSSTYEATVCRTSGTTVYCL
jgi:hypothetical protein